MAGVHPLLTELLTSTGVVCRAEALALYTSDGARPRLAGDWRLDQQLYDLLASRWDDAEDDLQRGRYVQLRARMSALPILDRTGALLAVLLYVGSLPEEGARRIFLNEMLTRFGGMLASPTAPVLKTEQCSNLISFELADDHDELERQAYEELLDRCGWHVSRVARLLDMTRQALYAQLEKIQLIRPTRAARR